MVERLNGIEEVTGSNPVGSSLRSQRSAERRLSRRNFSGGGPVLPLPQLRGELRLGKPLKIWADLSICIYCRVKLALTGFTLEERRISVPGWASTMQDESRTRQNGDRGELRHILPSQTQSAPQLSSAI